MQKIKRNKNQAPKEIKLGTESYTWEQLREMLSTKDCTAIFSLHTEAERIAYIKRKVPSFDEWGLF